MESKYHKHSALYHFLAEKLRWFVLCSGFVARRGYLMASIGCPVPRFFLSLIKILVGTQIETLKGWQCWSVTCSFTSGQISTAAMSAIILLWRWLATSYCYTGNLLMHYPVFSGWFRTTESMFLSFLLSALFWLFPAVIYQSTTKALKIEGYRSNDVPPAQSFDVSPCNDYRQDCKAVPGRQYCKHLEKATHNAASDPLLWPFMARVCPNRPNCLDWYYAKRSCWSSPWVLQCELYFKSSCWATHAKHNMSTFLRHASASMSLLHPAGQHGIFVDRFFWDIKHVSRLTHAIFHIPSIRARLTL